MRSQRAETSCFLSRALIRRGRKAVVQVWSRTAITLSLLVTWAGMARAQAFEHAPVATLGVGISVPTQDMADLYDPGIVARLGVRMPLSQGMSFRLESGFSAPN